MKLIVEISTVNDGNMLIRDDPTNRKVQANRISFLAKNDIDIKQTTCVNIVYEGQNYHRYYEVSEDHKGNGMYHDNIIAADALVTRVKDHALFLPVADCIGAVIYDPVKNVLMLSHLGRHSLEQNGGEESIKFLVKYYGCNASGLKVWLTPSPGPDVYPMYRFEGSSIKNVALQQLKAAGILSENITDDNADTTKDERYFSHSEFLKVNQQDDGRYAIVAMMKD